MLKNNTQSKTEAITNKISNTAHIKSEDTQIKGLLDERSVQLRAYDLYCEKGGTALDNWLEAERILSKSDTLVSSFISEGNPNTQK
ncbi:MAG: DUF2934 domain-containing protein [Candidatus Omnitrophica bacterium]|nr:DUF2934 domain-containing protein [Candidatus Omnitrophota bacterium]